MSAKESTAETTVIYQSAAARVATLYRLRSVPPGRRTLLLTVPGRDLLAAEGWDGDVVSDFVGYGCDNLYRHPDASFDRVVLHWSYGEFVATPPRRRAARQRAELLREVRRILTPGGVVAGCVVNYLNPSENLRWPLLGWTGRQIRRELAAGGFEQIRVGTVLPSADAPWMLISQDRHAARSYFRLHHERNRDMLNPLSRWARHLLVEAGLAQYLQGSVLFSGHAPC